MHPHWKNIGDAKTLNFVLPIMIPSPPPHTHTPLPNSHIQTKKIGKLLATLKLLVFPHCALQCQRLRKPLPHPYLLIKFSTMAMTMMLWTSQTPPFKPTPTLQTSHYDIHLWWCNMSTNTFFPTSVQFS